MYAGIFTTFTEVLSGPVTFLASKLLIILLIWSTVAGLIFTTAVVGNIFLKLMMLE